MDQHQRVAALQILEAVEELDYAAGQFYSLMLEKNEQISSLDKCLEVEAAPDEGDLLVSCHRVRCLAKYVHVLEPADGKNGLFGQYQFFELGLDGKPIRHIWSLQFDRHGDTEFERNAASVIAEGPFRKQTRNAFAALFVQAIQSSLAKPEEV